VFPPGYSDIRLLLLAHWPTNWHVLLTHPPEAGVMKAWLLLSGKLKPFMGLFCVLSEEKES
jgi:hypothetical protein